MATPSAVTRAHFTSPFDADSTARYSWRFQCSSVTSIKLHEKIQQPRQRVISNSTSVRFWFQRWREEGPNQWEKFRYKRLQWRLVIDSIFVWLPRYWNTKGKNFIYIPIIFIRLHHSFPFLINIDNFISPSSLFIYYFVHDNYHNFVLKICTILM